MTGALSLTHCRLGVEVGAPCAEEMFVVRSLPPTFNSSYADVCDYVETGAKGQTAAGVCSLQDGRDAPGRVAAVVSAHSCAEGWHISWQDSAASVWYKDASRFSVRLATGSITASSGRADGPVTVWDVQVDVSGPAADGSLRSWSLAGIATATGGCDAGISHVNFVTTVGG